ncbi:hypothetical protein BOVA711_5106 [Bacteroides ovatus]|nr:hypothetical protein BOVA711_5106 [Bacteroides ovatus]
MYTERNLTNFVICNWGYHTRNPSTTVSLYSSDLCHVK